MKKIFLVLFAALLLFPVINALTQDAPPITLNLTGVNASQIPDIVINADLVDSAGKPITGLTLEDFSLSGALAARARIVSVENVTEDDLAFAVVLVIDTSSSMAGKPIARAKEAALQFVNSLRSQDPIAIVTFDSQARVVQEFTVEKFTAISTINNLQFGGKTALYDGALLGIQTASEAPVERRVVVVLSDGAEFGNLSSAGRNEALETARQRGISVFTIGLGFGTDRTFLAELASGTNAAFEESPTPDELAAIYAELARIFRSEYVVKLAFDNFDVQQDGGDELGFTLNAQTDSGAISTNGTVRLPIPVPVITLPEGTFSTALTEATTITPIVEADDGVTSVSFSSGAVTAEGESFTINPLEFQPGSYPLTITATDNDGDVGTLEATFEVAALPSQVEVLGVPDTPLTAPVIVVTNATGQTPAASVTYIVGDQRTDSPNAAQNFPFTLDPLKFAPGEYTLGVEVLNEGGATATVELPFSVAAVPPQVSAITGITEGQTISEAVDIAVETAPQAGATVASVGVTVGTAALEGVTLDPQAFPPGETPVTVTVTDSNGQTASQTINVSIAALPPQITLGGELEGATLTAPVVVPVTIASQTEVTEVTFAFDDGTPQPVEADEIAVPADTLGNGGHTLTVTVTNAGGQTSTITSLFTVNMPTPTPTVDATGTSVALADIAQATLNAESTQVAQLTADALLTLDAGASQTAVVTAQARATQNAQATVDAEASLAADSTLSADATTNAQATSNAEGTLEAIISATSVLVLTDNARSTERARETQAAQSTSIALANLEAFATATADAQFTLDAAAALTARPTLLAQTTRTAQALTQTAQALSGGTEAALATITAQFELTANSIETQNAELANANAGSATAGAEADDDTTATAAAEGTTNAAATLTAQPTLTATVLPTRTVEPTLVPVSDTPPSPIAGLDPPQLALLCLSVVLGVLLLVWAILGPRRGRKK